MYGANTEKAFYLPDCGKPVLCSGYRQRQRGLFRPGLCLPCAGPAGPCCKGGAYMLTAARFFAAMGAAVVVFLQAIGTYDTPLWRLVGAVAGTALGL